ncbi:MAG: hypothetical protein ACHQUA_02680 [Microgenomates group bacterium]
MPGIEDEARTEINGRPIQYFSVDLMEKSELDLEKFDGLAKKIGYRDDGDNSYLGVIVASDRMFLFNARIPHVNMFKALMVDENLSSSEIQCGTHLKIDHRIKTRTISGNIEGFKITGLLPYDQSDTYKKGLPAILGKGFQAV